MTENREKEGKRPRSLSRADEGEQKKGEEEESEGPEKTGLRDG